jgi:hypothetical protein
MRTIRLKVSDLFESEGAQPVASPAPDLATVTALVLRQLQFLPQPLTVQLEGDEVVLGNRYIREKANPATGEKLIRIEEGEFEDKVGAHIQMPSSILKRVFRTA